MSEADRSASTADPSTGPSLGELRARLLADETLPETRRRDMASAVASLAKAIGKPAEVIPANPKTLRAEMKGLTAAMVGMKTGRWKNVQSLVGAALGHFGIVVVQGRIREAPSPEWQAILGLLETDAGRHFHLWRFARYCTQTGVAPDAVCDALIARYEDDLICRSLVSEPERSAREAARFWNEAAAAHPAWPQQRLALPDNRNVFAPGWETYPESLVRDAGAWCASLGDSDPFAERSFMPLKPGSVASRRKHLKLYLGALVLRGVDPADLVDLAAAVTPARATLALRFFWERAGKKVTTHTYALASTALMIARHWARLPQADVKRLADMTAQMRPDACGMTPGNRKLLMQLSDPDKRDALLELPSVLLAEAISLGAPTVQAALTVQTAVLIGVLLRVPMRLTNLRNLRVGVNLRPGPKGAMSVSVPGIEVKNGVAIDGALTGETARLLEIYIKRYRPQLVKGDTDFLFPGARAGAAKCAVGVREQIQRVLADRVGIDFNPHTFRHLAAYLMLQDKPGCYGSVQRVLGHKSQQSTMAFYSGLETPAALEDYDDLIAGLRGKAKPSRPPDRHQGRGR
jgi:integrase